MGSACAPVDTLKTCTLPAQSNFQHEPHGVFLPNSAMMLSCHGSRPACSQTLTRIKVAYDAAEVSPGITTSPAAAEGAFGYSSASAQASARPGAARPHAKEDGHAQQRSGTGRRKRRAAGQAPEEQEGTKEVLRLYSGPGLGCSCSIQWSRRCGILGLQVPTEEVGCWKSCI